MYVYGVYELLKNNRRMLDKRLTEERENNWLLKLWYTQIKYFIYFSVEIVENI